MKEWRKPEVRELDIKATAYRGQRPTPTATPLPPSATVTPPSGGDWADLASGAEESGCFWDFIWKLLFGK